MPLGRAAMVPLLIQFSIPPAVPLLLLVIALALGLTVLGLSLLLREKPTIARSALTVCVVVPLLFALKPPGAGRMHVGVTPFGAALAVGVTLGWVASLRTAAKHGLDQEWMTRFLGASLLGGLIGARLGYVLLCAPHDMSWREYLRFERGGLFGYGACLGGALGAALASRNRVRQLRQWLDLSSPLFLAFIAIVRVGCYLEGCDFGRPAVATVPRFVRSLGTYPRWSKMADGSFSGPPAWLHHVSDFGLSTESVTSLPTHPTQLYELLLALLLAGAATRMNRVKAFDGRTFLAIAFLYSVGRYFLEMLRGDPDRGLFAAQKLGHPTALSSWTQLCSVASTLVVVWYWKKWRRTEAFPNEQGTNEQHLPKA